MATLAATALAAVPIAILRFVPPPTTAFMLRSRHADPATGAPCPDVAYAWVPREAIAADLRLAVLDGLLERWNDILPKLLMAAAGGEDRFETIVRETVTFFNDDPDRARLLMREILDRPEDMRTRLEEHVAPWVNVVADYIRKGQRSGELHHNVDPEAYILQVVNLIVSGVASASCLDGGLLPPKSPQGDPATRHARELMRIARVSLFVEPHVSERGEHAEDKVEEDGDEEDIDEVRDGGKDRIYDKLHAFVFGDELEWA